MTDENKVSLAASTTAGDELAQSEEMEIPGNLAVDTSFGSTAADKIADDDMVKIRCCGTHPAPFCGVVGTNNNNAEGSTRKYHEDTAVFLEFKHVQKCRLWRDDILHVQMGSRKLDISTFRPYAVVQLVADYLRNCNMRKLTIRSTSDARGYVGSEEEPHDVPQGVRLTPLSRNTDMIEAVLFYNELGFEWLESYVVQKICGKLTSEAWPIALDNRPDATFTERIVPLGELLAYFLGEIQAGCAEKSANSIVDSALKLLASRMEKLQSTLRPQLGNRPVYAIDPKRINPMYTKPIRYKYREMSYEGELLRVWPLLHFLPENQVTDYVKTYMPRSQGERKERKYGENESDDYEESEDSKCLAGTWPTAAAQKLLQLLLALGSVFDGTFENADADADAGGGKDDDDEDGRNSPAIPFNINVKRGNTKPGPLRVEIRHMQAQLFYCAEEAVSYLCQMMWRKHEIAYIIANALELPKSAPAAEYSGYIGRHMFYFDTIIAAYIESYVGYHTMKVMRPDLFDENPQTALTVEANFRKVCMGQEVLPFAARIAASYAKSCWQLSCEVASASKNDQGWYNLNASTGNWVGCIVGLRVMPLVPLDDVFAYLCRVFDVGDEKFADNPDNGPFTICLADDRRKTGMVKFEYQLGSSHNNGDDYVMPREQCVSKKTVRTVDRHAKRFRLCFGFYKTSGPTQVARELRRFLHGVSHCNVYSEPLASILAKNNVNKRFMCYRNEAAAERDKQMKVLATVARNPEETNVRMLKQIASSSDFPLMVSISRVNGGAATGEFYEDDETVMPLNITLSGRLESTIPDLVAKIVGPKFLALGSDGIGNVPFGFHLYYYTDAAGEKLTSTDVDGYAVLDGIASGNTTNIAGHPPSVVLERIEITNAHPNATMFWLLKIRARLERHASEDIMQTMMTTYYTHNEIGKKLKTDGEKQHAAPAAAAGQPEQQKLPCTCKLCGDFVQLFLRPPVVRLYYDVIPSIERAYGELMDQQRAKPRTAAWYEQKPVAAPAKTTTAVRDVPKTVQPAREIEAPPAVQPPRQQPALSGAPTPPVPWFEAKREQELKTARALMPPMEQRRLDRYQQQQQQQRKNSQVQHPQYYVTAGGDSGGGQIASSSNSTFSQPVQQQQLPLPRSAQNAPQILSPPQRPRRLSSPVRPPSPQAGRHFHVTLDFADSDEHVVDRVNQAHMNNLFVDLYGDDAWNDDEEFAAAGSFFTSRSESVKNIGGGRGIPSHNVQPRTSRPNEPHGWPIIRGRKSGVGRGDAGGVGRQQ